MAKRGSGKVKGEILAEYEGLTISVSPQKAKRAGKDRLWIQIRQNASLKRWRVSASLTYGVYPGFPTLFWGLSVFFVGDLMGKALWKLVENAARFPRRGGRVLCVHGAVSFHRARPCGPRWLPGRGAMRHVELDRRVLGLQSTGE